MTPFMVLTSIRSKWRLPRSTRQLIPGAVTGIVPDDSI